eukprot:CAMPEP_0174301836 /NCGR_PEP_ID=MMETSP0809-20121228/59281_1 /TAXON_ID=73025 ORGANISM="Eutreptiella gymnastica-like, Strain CCMP1594" /NCGR_SAMPLE_ID=MMETSP0809 /ASSEMBLY_ACC=CAM_ASM_000658 /LENGTH=105 /DNA_ID=CAMNT_0015407651 /DNA_START=900 /DNA_END=1214 /DNA_ORIENTATION=+
MGCAGAACAPAGAAWGAGAAAGAAPHTPPAVGAGGAAETRGDVGVHGGGSGAGRPGEHGGGAPRHAPSGLPHFCPIFGNEGGCTWEGEATSGEQCGGLFMGRGSV